MARLKTGRSSAGFGRTATRHSTDDGFTLAEVLVAFGLFTVLAMAATTALVTTLRFTTYTEDRVAATNLARQMLEELRSQNSNALSLDDSLETQTLHGKVYTITPTYAPAATAACASGSTRRVTITVTWNNSGTRSVRYDSVLSC